MKKRIKLTESQLHDVIRKCINEAFRSEKLQKMYDENGGFDDTFGGSSQGWADGNHRLPLSDIEDDDIEDEINDYDGYSSFDNIGKIQFKNGKYVNLKRDDNGSMQPLRDKYPDSSRKNRTKRISKNIADKNASGNDRIAATSKAKQHSDEIRRAKSVLKNPNRYFMPYDNDERRAKDQQVQKSIRRNLDNRKNGITDYDYSDFD